MSPWYADAFDADYLERYAHRDDSEARRGVELLAGAANPEPGARVFDLCCGAGRHMVAMAERGWSVMGGDLSGALVTEANRRELRVLRLDMRHLPLADSSFDLVTNFFTAFGYFPTDSENLAVFREVRRILRPGGYFLIDFLEATTTRAHVLANPAGELPSGRVERWLTSDGSRAEKRQYLERNGETRVVEESVRLFTGEELAAGLANAGLHPVHQWGDYDGGELQPGVSPRCIILARAAG